jgi:hypothetical protein
MRKRDTVEIVAIAVPILAEFIAVSLFIVTVAFWVLYFGGLLELPI